MVSISRVYGGGVFVESQTLDNNARMRVSRYTVQLSRPFSAVFHPFPEGLNSTWEFQKTEEKALSDPTEIPPPYRERGVAIPLSHCVSWAFFQMKSNPGAQSTKNLVEKSLLPKTGPDLWCLA